MKFNKTILVTGGAGFIGSNLIKHLVKKYPNNLIINLDSLTYAGNLFNLLDVRNENNYLFVKKDIRNKNEIDQVFNSYNIDTVLNLAAESHVDRSIINPNIFVETNVIGTVNLLNACKQQWSENYENKLFYHISTDEVFGSLDDNELFNESTKYDPKSPYSASKASSDHFVRAYHNTYGIPIIISNCSNNYGPHQFPEKLIPLFIYNIINNKILPVYGNGNNVRDWLYVEDHVKAIDLLMNKGKIGDTYCIGGFNEFKNIDIVKIIIEITDNKLNRESGSSLNLIKYVNDRLGHDHRYAIDSTKIHKNLGWKPEFTFQEGIKSTVDWYVNNVSWIEDIFSGKYQNNY